MEHARQILTSDADAQVLKFLIVDDDEVSIMAIKRGLKKLNITNPIHVACDGQAALDLLRGEAGHEKLDTPFIITLDINMPRMNGLEFLEIARNDPELRDTIIFVLTTSDAKSDIQKAYQKNVTGYILKDNVADSLKKALEMIGDYSNVVILPR